MTNTTICIEYPAAGWKCHHDSQTFSGPFELTTGGAPLGSLFALTAEDGSPYDIALSRSRCYRKGGAAVYEGEGTLTRQPSHGVRQVNTYVANTVRVAVDFHWGQDAVPPQGLSLCTLRLPGEWRRLKVLGQGADAPAPTWKDLASGRVLTWDATPAVMLLEGRKGLKLEIDAGFDLWRWNHGIGMGGVTTCLHVGDEEAVLTHRILPAGYAEELLPESRTYRFNSYLAWSCPKLVPPELPPDLPPALFKADGSGLDMASIAGDVPAINVDLRRLTLPPSAYEGGRPESERLCWSSKATQGAAKRIIRQLANSYSKGVLQWTGVQPGFCDLGNHCQKRNAVAHWDHQEILQFFAWARQILGDGWTVQVPQKGFWAELPSLACLGAFTGFRATQGL